MVQIINYMGLKNGRWSWPGIVSFTEGVCGLSLNEQVEKTGRWIKSCYHKLCLVVDWNPFTSSCMPIIQSSLSSQTNLVTQDQRRLIRKALFHWSFPSVISHGIIILWSVLHGTWAQDLGRALLRPACMALDSAQAGGVEEAQQSPKGLHGHMRHCPGILHRLQSLAGIVAFPKMNAADVPSVGGGEWQRNKQTGGGWKGSSHFSVPRDLEQSYFSFLHVKI